MLKNYEIINIFEGLQRINVNPAPVKFMYAVSRNKKILLSEYRELDEMRKPTEEVFEYERKRIEICEEYSEKDENGNIKKRPTGPNTFDYIIEEKYKEGFDKEMKKLEEKYKESLDNHKKKIEDFKSLLQEDSNTENLHKVKLEDVPTNLNQNIMDLLIDVMIIEE